MSLANYGENTILDDFFTIFGATLYVGLSTADPGDDAATLAEPSGNGYARKSTTNSDWGAASGGSRANSAAITFDAATGSWGTVTHVCIFDAVSGGNLIASGALTASQAISTDQIARFDVGDLTLSLD